MVSFLFLLTVSLSSQPGIFKILIVVMGNKVMDLNINIISGGGEDSACEQCCIVKRVSSQTGNSVVMEIFLCNSGNFYL